MKTRTFLALAATTAIAATAPRLDAQAIGTLTGETYNASTGGFSYSNASSIPVSSTDLIEGQLPIATNYVGTYEAAGGTLGVLTDGSTGGDSGNAPSSNTDAAFDLNTNFYAEYALPHAVTLTSVVVTTGHADNRVDQDYDILVSTNGTSFISLSDGTSHTLGGYGSGFSYSPSTGTGGAAQSTVSPINANLGTGIKFVEFVAEGGDQDVYRELDVNGTVPEPTIWAELALGVGALALVVVRRAARA